MWKSQLTSFSKRTLDIVHRVSFGPCYSRCCRFRVLFSLASADVALGVLHSDAAVLSYHPFFLLRHRLHSVVHPDAYQIYTIQNVSVIFPPYFVHTFDLFLLFRRLATLIVFIHDYFAYQYHSNINFNTLHRSNSRMSHLVHCGTKNIYP